MKVKLLIEGGKMQPGPAVAQQLGPMGINLGKVIADVNTATAGFKGMNVPVELDVDPKTKTYKIEVFSPSTAELIKKELGLEKGSGAAKTNKVANASLETIIKITKTKQEGLLARDLKAAVKLVVGTCVSLGVMVDNKEAKEIERDIDSGKYDKEIKNEITETPEEKKRDLQVFFAQIVAQQEKTKKALEEATAAAEAAKAAAATAVAATATPAAAGKEGAKTAAAATGTAEAAKPAAGKEEKKPAAKKK